MFLLLVLSLAAVTSLKEAGTELERKTHRAVHRAYYSGEKLPNFSWIHEDGVCALGGMAAPRTKKDVLELEKMNVDTVFDLRLTHQDPEKYYTGTTIKRVSYPIADHFIPSFKMLEDFLEKTQKSFDQKKKVVVHCRMGKGRTGTFLAAWLIANKGMTAQQAIDTVRAQRPGSIEPPHQEYFLDAFWQYKKAQQTIEELKKENTELKKRVKSVRDEAANSSSERDNQEEIVTP
jgi:atypical dual specificity phosphatase